MTNDDNRKLRVSQTRQTTKINLTVPQFAAAGSLCRKSAGDCDLPDFCTGASGDCPEDDFHMNGKPCYDRAPGYCYNGRCPTHEEHCWRLFGPGTVPGFWVSLSTKVTNTTGSL